MARAAERSGNTVPTSHDFMDDAFRDRISEVVAEVGGSVAAGQIAGVSDEAIGRWRKGPVKPPFAGVIALCRAAKFSVEWMATGEGPRRLQPEGALPPTRTEREHGGHMQVDGMELRALDPEMISLPRLNIIA